MPPQQQQDVDAAAMVDDEKQREDIMVLGGGSAASYGWWEHEFDDDGDDECRTVLDGEDDGDSDDGDGDCDEENRTRTRRRRRRRRQIGGRNNSFFASLSFDFLSPGVPQEMRHQLRTAVPTLWSMTLNKIPWMISLHFVGNFGAPELAAAALATTIFNVTGLSLSVGLSSALTTLTGQARGDLQARSSRQKQEKAQQQQRRKQQRQTETSKTRNLSRESSGGCEVAEDPEEPNVERMGLLLHKINSGDEEATVLLDNNDDDDSGTLLLPLVYLYRGLFVQLLFVLPMGLWWLRSGSTEHALLQLGQGEALSRMTSNYLRILAPGLWAYSVNWTVTAWLQALELAAIPAYAAAAGLVTHVPFNYLYCHVLGLGYLGCAWATVTYQLLQPVLVLSYLMVVGGGAGRDGGGVLLRQTHAAAVGRTRLSFWSEAREAVTRTAGLLQYCALALPGIVLISEWWASEVMIFLAGQLQPAPDLALGGMTLYQTINSFCFMFPVAFSISGSARVGSLLGAGDANQAEFSGKVCVLCAGTISGALGCLLYFLPHTWIPSLFAPSEHDLIAEAASTVPLLALYVWADGVQTSLNGIIKGCGKQAITMPIVVFAYWICAVPLGYYLAFVRYDGTMCDDSFFCGVVALVTGATTGTVVHMILLAVVVFWFTEWDVEVKKAQERVGASACTSASSQQIKKAGGIELPSLET